MRKTSNPPKQMVRECPRKGKIVHRWTATLASGSPKFKVAEYGIVWVVFENKALWSARHIKPSKHATLLLDVKLDELRVISIDDLEDSQKPSNPSASSKEKQ